MITPDLYNQILIKTEQLQPELKKIRRTLHQYPETGWMEMRTSSIIAGYLKKFNFDEILTGEAVCKANARMGIPDKNCLSEHTIHKRSIRRGQILHIFRTPKRGSPV